MPSAGGDFFDSSPSLFVALLLVLGDVKNKLLLLAPEFACLLIDGGAGGERDVEAAAELVIAPTFGSTAATTLEAAFVTRPAPALALPAAGCFASARGSLPFVTETPARGFFASSLPVDVRFGRLGMSVSGALRKLALGYD